MVNTRVFGTRNPRSNRGGATKTDTADSVKLKTTNVMMNKERFQRCYQSTPHFRIENPNPRWADMRGFAWDTPDCVIRALANATGCSWLEAFDYLTPRARKEYTVLNDGVRFRKWAQDSGAVWTACKIEKKKVRMTAEEFAETHPTGRYILRLSHHEAACVDGVILDAWNCGRYCVYGYLDMANFKLD